MRNTTRPHSPGALDDEQTIGKLTRSPLDSRLRREEKQSYSPATSSILAAAQGLSEDSLLVLAEVVTHVARVQGGRAGRQRRGAIESEAPKTLDHVQAYLDQQNEVLGGCLLRADNERNIRRSSSCPSSLRIKDKETDICRGNYIQSTKDIKSKGVVVVKSGTKGIVNTVLENGKLNVSFDERTDKQTKPINVKIEAVAVFRRHNTHRPTASESNIVQDLNMALDKKFVIYFF